MTPRCACRPGCLCSLRPSDRTVPSVAGPVLVTHLTPPVYAVDGLCSTTSALSVVKL